ncbi:MAG: MFS transporter, partial [Acidimicrobiales bacterium]|nr:MFS transporter [Acidimicrobiales bacterium]
MAASEEASLGPRFWTLWSAFTATNLADGLSLVALPLLALAATDDARLVAMVVMFQYLPFLVIGLPAGVVIDRFDRRRIAVAAQMARAAVVGGLGLALLQGT